MLDPVIMLIALLAFAILALCASAVAVRSYKQIGVLRNENARRSREVAAYKSLSIDPESYGVPDIVVDQCRPVRIHIGDTFVLVGMLSSERLSVFTQTVSMFLAKYRHHADAVAALLTGKADDGAAKAIRMLINNDEPRKLLVEIIDKAILSNAIANPNGVTAEQFEKEIEPDQLMRMVYCLWEYNLGEHFKKKLQIQTLRIQQVMGWDLSGLPSLVSPQKNTLVNLLHGLPSSEPQPPNVQSSLN